MPKLIISIIIIFIAGGVFFFYTKPSYDQVQVQQSQTASYNAALDKAAELQQLKQGLLSRYNAFNPNDVDRLQKLLPDHVDNVALILDIDNLAAHYGLALANVDVSSPKSSASSQTALGVVGSGGQKYDSLTLKFSTRGTYTAFRQFMRDLEDALRIVDLDTLTISPAGIAGAGEEPLYTYDISLRTYWLK